MGATTAAKKDIADTERFDRTQMQKDVIIQRLRDRGCRITRQRKILLDVILEEKCSCCKEIYYQASKKDSGIGTATVYRMVNTLEEIGAIHRSKMYQVTDSKEPGSEIIHGTYLIRLNDGSVRVIDQDNWRAIMAAGLRACGLIDEQEVLGMFRPYGE